MLPSHPNHLSSLSSLVVLLLMLVVGLSVGDNNPGTTEHIQEIFVGRCYDYRQVKYKSLLPEVLDNCTGLWTKFFDSFSFMPPCAVSMSHYDPFMQAARQEIPRDKAMFWSGIKGLVHEYAAEGQRYFTLEDTLIGYMVDNLIWCGQGSPPGMNFSRCPSWTDCPLETSESFWASASKMFAFSVSGTVSVMLDGSQKDKPAYRKDSFFGKYELPYLSPTDVTKVLVLLVHPLNTPTYETCNNGSLKQLEADVTIHGFDFGCEDDPQAVLHLLCADHPSDRECRLASRYVFPGFAEDPVSIHPVRSPPVINTKPADRFSVDVPTAINLG